MNLRTNNLFLRLGAAMVIAVVAAVAGCTGGGSAGGPAAGSPASPPEIRVYQAMADPMESDPLGNPAWRSAPWYSLTGALNDPRSGPATRAALLYDADNLYIAFVSDAEPTPGGSDSVEIWLDSSSAHNGKELYSVDIKQDGGVSTAWYRATSPAQPKADGSPDYSQPILQIANPVLAGLVAKPGKGSSDGRPVWTMVVKMPLHSLPGPLRTDGVEGARWRMNLLRYNVEAPAAGGDPIVIQSNLAPIYQASQAVSPYRMAEVVLQGPRGVAQGDGAP